MWRDGALRPGPIGPSRAATRSRGSAYVDPRPPYRVGSFARTSDAGSNGLQADDEVELVYAGLMENERGAQASAAHWEAKNLSDDDIADLGYGPEGDAADERTA